ncbi:hypothetical protein AB6T85_23590 [Erwinia sp. ACCC 02193]|uniref:Uncharacterized protein n=1 Tax=Erwinia aeris TaxID=3239803 RepID=A0ABV4EEN3_9GAMM
MKKYSPSRLRKLMNRIEELPSKAKNGTAENEGQSLATAIRIKSLYAAFKGTNIDFVWLSDALQWAWEAPGQSLPVRYWDLPWATLLQVLRDENAAEATLSAAYALAEAPNDTPCLADMLIAIAENCVAAERGALAVIKARDIASRRIQAHLDVTTAKLQIEGSVA